MPSATVPAAKPQATIFGPTVAPPPPPEPVAITGPAWGEGTGQTKLTPQLASKSGGAVFR